jgi:two-component system sensor histidine kinase RstB
VNSIFLRIYAGMLATLVLVALLGVGSLQLVNGLRLDHYRERLASGTFHLMADNLAPMNAVERQRATALWERMLGVPLRLQTFSEVPLDAPSRGRLLRGHVLVQKSGTQPSMVYVLVSQAEQLLLTASVGQISEQLARATLYLLMDELARYPMSEQPRRLETLKVEKDFGFAVNLLPIERIDMDADQRRRVAEGDTVMALGSGGESIRVIASMVASPWVLELGPLYRMNAYPPHLLVLFVALGLSLIGLTLYWLVRRLERRLRGLEAAATRIAAGSLETRVPEVGTDSVGRLAVAFNVMTEHLQRLLSMQRELVRAVSHELRTPVARLRFGLEMVGEAPDAASRGKYLAGMDHDIQELDRLVDEMLVYARLEQGSPALNFQQVMLEALLDQVIDELAPLRADVRIERGLWQPAQDGSGSMVEAEPRYLHRAVQNLVSNALRHAESRVRVSYTMGTNRCRIDIEDDGPGVPEEAWERIFTTPFLRLDDSRTRASGGHGLGLSIVRRIIYWHGGRALIGRSALGGAQFSLVWPRRQHEGEQ